jgi:hypothetical protein
MNQQESLLPKPLTMKTNHQAISLTSVHKN